MSKPYSLAVAEAARVVAGITDDRLDHPTPCDGFTVHAETNHLYLAVEHVTALAEGVEIDLSRQTELLVGDWRADFAAAATRMAAALSGPPMPEGPAAKVGLTPALVGELALSELLIHGWDLAVATGQDFRPDPAVVEHVARFHDGGPNEVEPPGSFAAAVAVPADAPLLDRLLGGLGRDPGWTPGGVGGGA